MILSDLSVKRPVFASVLSILLVVFGLVSFSRLPLREYPDIDPPVVTVETDYPGASANVVETQITQLIEERIAGVEGIRSIESASTDGRSTVTVEFSTERDIDGATNDIRDRVSAIFDDLPDEADPPEIQKVDSNDDVIMWFNLVSDRLSVPELTDYADRYLVDRFSVLSGVSRVRIGGGQNFAMRVWLDRSAMAARDITVVDVELALRAENIEVPAGTIESATRGFTVRLERNFHTAADFSRLVVARGDNGDLIRLGEIARVERGTEENRTFFRGNGEAMVGLGIIKQSTANTIDVARSAKAEMARLNPTLPQGMEIKQSYDTSVFIEEAILEVYKTLAIAIGLVVLVIFLFLGSVRATLVPAVTVPVSIVATFIALNGFGFSVNLLTLLALVLAIGLLVDDSIVVLENIHRRIDERRETPLVAAFEGTRQVGFAVIATTLVLVAVFVPIAFLQGDVGRLFSEFALTMAAAVCFSSLVALSLSPMLSSLILKRTAPGPQGKPRIDRFYRGVRRLYRRILAWCIRRPAPLIITFILLLAGSGWLTSKIPSEYAPKEDRGAFFVIVNGPEGATYQYMAEYMDEIERRLLDFVDAGEVTRLLVRTPRGFGTISSFNSGIVIIVLNDYDRRRSAWTIMDEVRGRLAGLPGVAAFPVMRQGFGSSIQKPVQFVIGGGTYEELVRWRDILVEKIEADNPGLTGLDWDYKETKPQLRVTIDYDRAADLGVTVGAIGRTLETMLGSRRITTFLEEGEEYDVIVEGERDKQRSPVDLAAIYVRSVSSGELVPLANIVSLSEFADSSSLNRYNRVRAITLEANLADGLALGQALGYLQDLSKKHLPEQVIIDYKGISQDYQSSSQSIVFIFVLGIVVVFLVLAAQFESWLNPLIIMLTVPLAMAGGLFGLYLTSNTLNLYSQIGLVMLVGLAAKNGILIVEFINQLRRQRMSFSRAVLYGAEIRLRPIVMTGITTAAGAVPLILSSGAGAETRMVIGIVVLVGVLAATFFTMLIVPVAYSLLARRTGLPGETAQRLAMERTERKNVESKG
ncbi:efflux RND transporter permease subunit [Desulfopila aestuarii]|uniref:Multidrug efflux pump n=1 Tax=Desulfopila aestuarii DSM 18488 TaxID=1121416 RepID=A0A1M7YEU2_9BACT|nr:efflux RND transporter permease subunit [Desulfopila aestuarii]SHO51106.1 multidrug efflux pump [Desulfopila aestuarii DSM 18488]